MTTYTLLKDAIRAVIKQNGNQEITGYLLQQTLLTIVDNLGKDWPFAGVADVNTNPGWPDGNRFYLAVGPGTFTHFGGMTLEKYAIYAIMNTSSEDWEAMIVTDLTELDDAKDGAVQAAIEALAAAAYTKAQGDIAEGQGNTTKGQGNVAEQQGNVAESKGNVAESKGNVAEQKGNLANQATTEANNKIVEVNQIVVQWGDVVYDKIEEVNAQIPIWDGQIDDKIVAIESEAVVWRSDEQERQAAELIRIENSEGREITANKQNSLALDGTGVKYPTVDAITDAIIPTEEVTAQSIVELKAEINALRTIITNGILGKIQINTLDIVDEFNIWGKSNMILVGTAVPNIVPDFAGQVFINTTAKVAYTAKGNSSVSDWN